MPTSERDGLKIDGLTVHYRGLTALDNVSLHVPDGKIVSVLGANGAGKSTLLKAVMGQANATAGSITVDGAEMLGTPTWKIARQGLLHLPEGRGLHAELTVRQNLELARNLRRGDIPDDVIAKVGEDFPILVEKAEHRVGTLSGGQQQMLTIARIALALPRFVLIDELSFGLAPIIVSQAFNILKSLHEAHGTGVLLVEQSVGSALKVSDYVYLLKRGQVVFSGTPGELADSEALLSSYLGSHMTHQTVERLPNP